MNDPRPDKISWYFKIAKVVAERSPCISRRRFGAVLVKNDSIIATGYAGTIRGATNCGIDTPCLKDLYSEAPDKSYEHCVSIHAEQNAIVNAAREGISTVGATMYVTEMNGRSAIPCFLCRRFIVNAGIKDVYDGNDSKDCRHYDVQKDFIKLENDRIADELSKAPKEATEPTKDGYIKYSQLRKKGKCVNCREEKELVTTDDLCQTCFETWQAGIG